MPVAVYPASMTAYAAFPPELDRDWLGRVCQLSGSDLTVIRRRTDPERTMTSRQMNPTRMRD